MEVIETIYDVPQLTCGILLSWAMTSLVQVAPADFIVPPFDSFHLLLTLLHTFVFMHIPNYGASLINHPHCEENQRGSVQYGARTEPLLRFG